MCRTAGVLRLAPSSGGNYGPAVCQVPEGKEGVVEGHQAALASRGAWETRRIPAILKGMASLTAPRVACRDEHCTLRAGDPTKKLSHN